MRRSAVTATGAWLAATSSMFAAAGTAAQENVPAESTLQCASEQVERQTCPADTSAGATLVRSFGSGVCLLGNTWGYDDAGIWVKDGCSGEFVVGADAAGSGVVGPGTADETDDESAPDRKPTSLEYPSWGYFDPGGGFLVGRSDVGELAISGYALLRYLNQRGSETFTDHLGREQSVDLRRDIFSHRVIVFLNGWLATEKLVYDLIFWTVNATDQDAIFGNLGYRFSRKFNLYGGIGPNPGSRSVMGSHPYWLGTDRVMADEFFRPYFSMGIWANGEPVPGLWYDVMVSNTSSQLGITASQLDREFTYGGTVWWMPTTKEFGPRGAYGDWEMHQELATRFGLSYVKSPEQRFADIGDDPGNTTLKLADSLNLFSTGSLAPGVTVTKANYEILSLDAGIKYRGFFLQGEYYKRTLDNFETDGPLPVARIEDEGFFIQTSFFPIPQRLELYAATSQIYGDEAAGFGDSSEYLVGTNYYLGNSRNYRVNFQIMDVNNSPVGSTFGYYTAGQDGTTVSVAASVFF